MPSRQETPLACRLLPTGLYLAATLAIIDIIFGFITWLDDALSWIFVWAIPLPIIEWFSAAIAFLLAVGLRRRKRAAWIATTAIAAVLLCVYGFLCVITRFTPTYMSAYIGGVPDASALPLWLTCALATNAAILLVILLALIRHRHYYCVRSQPSEYKLAISIFILGCLAITVLGLNVLFLLHGISLHRARMLLFPPRDPHWLAAIMGFGWTVCFLLAMWVIMRAQHKAAKISAEEELRIRTLIAHNPNDSLGYFATRRDKSVLLTAHGGVSYSPVFGVALASADPLGDPATWPQATHEFLHYASEYGLIPAAIGVSESGAHAYVQAGLKAIRLGDEAILRPARFRLDKLPDVRQAVQHIRKLGYRARIRRHHSIPNAELAQLAQLSKQWLGGEAERGFSMALSRLADGSDGQCVMVEALFPDGDARGKVAALLSFVPWGTDGLSLDVMRRHPQADNGVTEFMVNALMSSGADLGITKVSLNFVVFRSVFESGTRIGANALLRCWHKILLFASRWWQLESLYRSNQKYDPEWFPRLLCYSDASHLPRISAAAAIAEGFLTLPARFAGLPSTQEPRTMEYNEKFAQITAKSINKKALKPLPSEMQARLKSRAQILAAGVEAYPACVKVDTSCAQAKAAGANSSAVFTVAGRVMAQRCHGKVIFIDLQDWSGNLQIVAELDGLGSNELTRLRRFVRRADQISVTGTMGTSRTGTPSLLARSWVLTSKALRPLPDKHRGLQDPQARVRQRHLTLITSPRARTLIEARTHAVQAVRQGLIERGYLEVETPMLHPVHGGANARPFRTHINAYDLDLYLRIAPELYLKRLLVGGMDRVFEIGRSFRNEGADATHNPEFTMLEAYQAYADYEVMKTVIQDLIVRAARAALGTTVVRGRVGAVEQEIDLAKPWRSISVCAAISQRLGTAIDQSTSIETLQEYAEQLALTYDPAWGWGTLVQHLYEHLAESSAVEPTFFTDFPSETSPLTRPHRSQAQLAERWDLVIFGCEVGTAYSELVDPVIQRQRLTAQSLAAAGGDGEAMELDEVFLQALEHGMPPTGGLGMGLDRLVMMLTNTSIRESIAFPLVKPEK